MPAYNGTNHRYVDFEDGVKYALQQKESKLMGLCDQVTNNGKIQYHDFIGEVGDFEEISGRHTNTKLTEVDHYRRAITCKPFSKAFLIDDEDKARQAHDIDGMYIKNTAMSYNRHIDKTVYNGFDAPVLAGENGTTLVARPTTNDVAHDSGYDVNGLWVASGGTSVGLTVDKLRRAKLMLDENYADELGTKYLVCHPRQVDNLLGTIEATNADYASVKALVSGEVDTLLGFKFIQYNGVSVTGGIYDAYAVVGSSMYFAKQKMTGPLKTSKSIRNDKNDATQILSKCDHGVSRMYDEGVIKVECKG